MASPEERDRKYGWEMPRSTIKFTQRKQVPTAASCVLGYGGILTLRCVTCVCHCRFVSATTFTGILFDIHCLSLKIKTRSKSVSRSAGDDREFTGLVELHKKDLRKPLRAKERIVGHQADLRRTLRG